MKIILITLTILTLTGCASLRGILSQYEVPEKAAKAVDNYCLSIPYAERQVNRKAVNDLTVSGDIAVTCVGDPE